MIRVARISLAAFGMLGMLGMVGMVGVLGCQQQQSGDYPNRVLDRPTDLS